MKKKPLPRVYWDATCFIAWLKPEAERKAQCLEVLKPAQEGKLEIVTSTISLIEVVKLENGPIIMTEAKQRLIRDFFKQPFIVPVSVTRRIAEVAQEMIWKHGFGKRDAIHAATVLQCALEDLHTYDADFQRMTEAYPHLRIAEPRADQRVLDLELPSEEAEAPEAKEGQEVN